MIIEEGNQCSNDYTIMAMILIIDCNSFFNLIINNCARLCDNEEQIVILISYKMNMIP